MSTDPITSMREAAIAINEMVRELSSSGFSREEAIRFTAIWLAEQGRTPQQGDDT